MQSTQKPDGFIQARCTRQSFERCWKWQSAVLKSLALASSCPPTSWATSFPTRGAALAAAITCASVGLAEAGIEMFDFVSGATVGWAEQRFFYDATAHEEETADALLTIAFMPSLGEISSIFQTGQLPAERQAEAVDQAVGGCNQTRNIQVLSLQHLVDADASA
eukprot:m.145928 g.145928  ORF g.145928 m.145928 type:complete len:164 (+) comp17235_c0_seq3:99-590(+)